MLELSILAFVWFFFYKTHLESVYLEVFGILFFRTTSAIRPNTISFTLTYHKIFLGPEMHKKLKSEIENLDFLHL